MFFFSVIRKKNDLNSNQKIPKFVIFEFVSASGEASKSFAKIVEQLKSQILTWKNGADLSLFSLYI